MGDLFLSLWEFHKVVGLCDLFEVLAHILFIRGIYSPTNTQVLNARVYALQCVPLYVAPRY